MLVAHIKYVITVTLIFSEIVFLSVLSVLVVITLYIYGMLLRDKYDALTELITVW